MLGSTALWELPKAAVKLVANCCTIESSEFVALELAVAISNLPGLGRSGILLCSMSAAIDELCLANRSA